MRVYRRWASTTPVGDDELWLPPGKVRLIHQLRLGWLWITWPRLTVWLCIGGKKPSAGRKSRLVIRKRLV